MSGTRTRMSEPEGNAPVPRPAKPDNEQVSAAEVAARRLDKPLGILGIIFLFVVLGQLLATEPTLILFFTVAGWVFWAVFVAELLLRAYIAGFSKAFWKKSWWQVVFLLVPFLRFFRALQVFRLVRLARLARYGSIVSAGVRGSRSAGTLLSSRIGWLVAVTAVVILASSQLLYAMGAGSYADSLFEAAMAAITGNGITATGALARFLQIVLAVYSVVVFATLAGSLGAFFMQPKDAAQGIAEREPRQPA